LNVLNDAGIGEQILVDVGTRPEQVEFFQLTLLRLRADRSDIDGKAVLAGGWRKKRCGARSASLGLRFPRNT